MSTQCVQGWQELIDDLNHLAAIKDHGSDQGVEVPPPSLIQGALSLAELLRQQGAVPAQRVSCVVAGKIHFEWFKEQSNLVIAVVAAGVAEVVTYSKQGVFAEEIFRW